MSLHRACPFVLIATRSLRNALLAFFVMATVLVTAAHAESIFRSGFEALEIAPVVSILRDDHVATLEMDYDAENAWGQWWTMHGTGSEAAGFLISWWPEDQPAPPAGAMSPEQIEVGAIGCLGEHTSDPKSLSTIHWMVTGNRRAQIQPLDNASPYRVRVQRINSLGEIISYANEQAFEGGDSTRVNALRTSMTYFDDFNLPMGPADEKLWNNATVTSTDARFNLFFINDQLHAHSLNGTRLDNTGDKSQTSQRFRKPLRIENGVRRRIVFDMDSPLSPRSVWYLDLNPVHTDVTGHADFFDQEGATGLPAGMLRLRAQFQTFSVSIIGMDGASHQIASVDMEAAGRQAVSNVRRSFEARVGTEGIEVLIDGRSVINTLYTPYSLQAGDYEPLWIAFGYNTLKDANPYYLVHWDNFGFDGPAVDPREVHNYVTRIAGTDYQKASRGNNAFPTFTINVPDDLRPTISGSTAEAWLVMTYQMGDFSSFNLIPGDHVTVNGSANFALPARINNSLPNIPALLSWEVPSTVRIKLGDLVRNGTSPLVVGANTFQFFADNTGIIDAHVETFYPPASAPAYTPPANIHHFPLHSELPRLGLPARFEQIGSTQVSDEHLLGGDNPPVRISVGGIVPLTMVVGNHSYANWAPELMLFPVNSTEVWSTGGTTGIAKVEVFLRVVGSGTGPGENVLTVDTSRDVPAPQGRYTRTLDTHAFANGDYELFVQATSPSGLKSHPSYGHETYLWDAADLSGAYYPIQIHIQN